MERALELARLGGGWTHPNPRVGAVLVQDGVIVGEGYHARVGGPHAEVVALAAAGEAARGATLYVTLEPCNHHGRTPPCTVAVIRAGIRRVVYAVADANPRTASQAPGVLRAAGIEVDEGLLGDEAWRLNEAFFKHVRTGRPFVTLKMAMTLDGKIATAGGESRYISGEVSRAAVQQLRAESAAVMVGINTVRLDDPRLDARVEGAHQPARVIVDPLAATSPEARLFELPGPVYLAVGPAAPGPARAALVARGATVLELPELAPGTLDLDALMAELGRRDLVAVLLEGGGGLNASALRQGIVDKVVWFVAPRLLGGRHSLTPVEGPDPEHLTEGLALYDLRGMPSGEDYRLEAYLHERRSP